MTKTRRDQMFRAKGYIPAPEVIERLGVHHATLYRWIRDKKVESSRVGKYHYLKVSSLVDFIGQEAAEVLGFVKPESKEPESSAPTD